MSEADQKGQEAALHRPLYPPARVAALRRAVERLWVADPALAAACLQGLEALLPALPPAPSLAALVAATRAGDRDAAARLRATLDLSAPAAVGPCGGSRPAAPQRFGTGALPSGRRLAGGVSQTGLASLAAGAVAAHGPDAAGGLRALLGLRRQVCRWGLADRLYDALGGDLLVPGDAVPGEATPGGALESDPAAARHLLERTLTRRADDGRVRPRSPQDFDEPLADLCAEPDFPPDFWDPDKELPEDLPGNVWDEPWFRDAYEFWRDFTRFQAEAAWTLTLVGSPIVCPGELVTLVAVNVPEEPGLVVFPGRRRGERIPVVAESWERVGGDDSNRFQITARVPAGAGCGYLGLTLRGGTPTGPRGFLALGNNLNAYFDGALPWLRSLYPLRGGTRVLPGEEVPMAWELCPSDCTARVQLRLDTTLVTPNLVDEALPSPPAPQEYLLRIPEAIHRTTRLRFEVRCHNACTPPAAQDTTAAVVLTVHRAATVWLEGIEITQGVQHFRAAEHLPQREAQADNSIPLVHRKPTLARVYFRCDQADDFNDGQVSGVRVRLRAEVDDGELSVDEIEPHNPDPLVATNDGGVAAQRGNLARSANFVLPDDWTWSDRRYRLRAVLELEEGSLDRADPERSAVDVRDVQFRRVFNPDVRLVRYRYTGGGDDSVDLLPSAAEALQAVRGVRRGLPVRNLTIRIPVQDEVRTFENHLDFDDLTHISGWEALLRDLVWVALDYDDAKPCIWNGVLDESLGEVFLEGSPSASDGEPTLAAAGITWPGIVDVDVDFSLGFWSTDLFDGELTFCAYTAFLAGLPAVARHEYGHVYDRGHPGGGGVQFAGFHAYPPYALPDYGHAVENGCGEYGVDVEAYLDDPSAAAVKDPDRTSDSMVLAPDAAEGGRWPSPYLWRGLARQFLTTADALRAHFGARPEFDLLPARPRQRLFVAGTLHPASGELSLRMPVHHRATLARAPVGRPTKVVLRLLNAAGEILHQEPLFALGRSPGRLRFAATPPLPPGTERLVLADGEHTFLDLGRPARGPVVEDLALERQPAGRGGDKGEEIWVLTWKVSHPQDRALHVQARFTADDGASWQPLGEWAEAGGGGAGGVKIEAAGLPGGDRCRVRLLVSDDFNTVHADSDPFERSVPPARLEILSPSPGAELIAGRAVRLEAEVLLHGRGEADDGAVTWTSDRQGLLGHGRLLVARLDDGKHRLTVRVGEGEETPVGEASVEVAVTAGAAPPSGPPSGPARGRKSKP